MFETLVVTGLRDTARRIERTCKRIGVDVASDAVADVWKPDAAAILEVAERTRSAVHPGQMPPRYRADLSRAVRERGVTFLGPSTEVLDLFADKTRVKDVALEAGVIPLDSSAPLETCDDAMRAASEIGYPVVVKPIAGMCGIGVFVAREEEELPRAFERAVQLAGDELGDRRVFVERFLEQARQIEVSVLVDRHGNTSPLDDRESSLSRFGRVFVTESPAPAFHLRRDGFAEREEFVHAAAGVASALGVCGFATVEFLVDTHGQLWFLEANHDLAGALVATEMQCGADPIELELDVARDKRVVVESSVKTGSHIFEARIWAGDPSADATAFSGPELAPLTALRFPPGPISRVRVEPWLEVGECPSSMSPLVASVATVAPIRHVALLALDRTLAESQVEPGPTNLELLRRFLNHEAVRAGQYDKSLAERVG
jgi:acetyl/propionyl-CoA carboxylase alpha subunit